jgi:glutamyl-tRNA reductase
MQLYAFGLNHQTAPLAVREQVAFRPESMENALRDLVENGAAKEAAILSTCNRMELYCNAAHPNHAIDWLAQYHHSPAKNSNPIFTPCRVNKRLSTRSVWQVDWIRWSWASPKF